MHVEVFRVVLSWYLELIFRWFSKEQRTKVNYKKEEKDKCAKVFKKWVYGRGTQVFTIVFQFVGRFKMFQNKQLKEKQGKLLEILIMVTFLSKGWSFRESMGNFGDDSDVLVLYLGGRSPWFVFNPTYNLGNLSHIPLRYKIKI